MVSALLQALLTANKELNRSASGELCNPYQASKSTKFGAYTHSQLPATSLYFNVIAQSKPLSCYAQMLHITSRSGTSLLSLPFSPAWHIWFSHWKLPHQADFSSSSLISAPAAGHLGTALGSRGPSAVWRQAQQTPALPRASQGGSTH